MSAKQLKRWNTGLWAAQLITGAMFLMAGSMKLLQPIQALSASLPWTGQVEPGLVRTLGFLDLLGGAGLLLPSLLRIRPSLTILAAYGSILLMISAIIFHIIRGESAVIGFNFLLIALLVFIVWGRTKKVPIHAR